MGANSLFNKKTRDIFYCLEQKAIVSKNIGGQLHPLAPPKSPPMNSGDVEKYHVPHSVNCECLDDTHPGLLVY